MGGFHPIDVLVLIGIALLILGPKTVQSMARSAGRGFRQAKEAKKKVLAELPVEDVVQISKAVSHIPSSPQQAARRLIRSTLLPVERNGEEESTSSGRCNK